MKRMVEQHPAPTPSATVTPVMPGSPTDRRSVTVRVVLGLVYVAVGVVVLQRSGSPGRGLTGGAVASIVAVAALVAIAGYLALFVALHVVPTGYSPVRNAVSDYAVGTYRGMFTTALYVSSIGVFAVAVALVCGVGSPPVAVRDVGYLLLIPVARVGMSMFPTTLEGQRLTRTALVHYVCAVAAFTLTYLAISGITPTLLDLHLSGWLSGPLRWARWAVTPELVLVVVTMLRPLRRIFGLWERLFLVTTNIWFLLAAIMVLAQAS